MKNALKLLGNNPSLFWHKVRKRFSSAYHLFDESRDQLLIGLIYANLCKALLKKETLKTAYVGSDILSINDEALAEFGFLIEDRKKAYFEGPKNDSIHPYQEIYSLNLKEFDVLLIGEKEKKQKKKIIENLSPYNTLILDLEKTATHLYKTLSSIKSKHFLSCLNLHKIASIALVLSLCPSPQPIIVEAGAFKCGTTLFMAKFLKRLGKTPTIYALDTFKGIPKAQDEDKKHGVVFDEGMFIQVKLEEIKKRLKKEGVNEHITLVPGLIQETLPEILENEKTLSFLFLDTDQYAGTKACLDMILPNYQNLLVLIDDSTLPGVNQAINESLSQVPEYRRERLVTNVDILFPSTQVNRFSYF